MNVFEMKCLRSMQGITRFDRVRNDTVRERTDVRMNLSARVDANVLRWFGHVERMDGERLLKRLIEARVNGRCVKGKPRFGWKDGVRKALEVRGLNLMDARERARNRGEWRVIVTQFG